MVNYSLEEFKKWLENKDIGEEWDWKGTIAFYERKPTNFNSFILEVAQGGKNAGSNQTLIKFVNQWKAEVDARERERERTIQKGEPITCLVFNFAPPANKKLNTDEEPEMIITDTVTNARKLVVKWPLMTHSNKKGVITC